MLRIAGGILISFFAIQILKFVVGFCLGYRNALAGKTLSMVPRSGGEQMIEALTLRPGSMSPCTTSDACSSARRKMRRLSGS